MSSRQDKINFIIALCAILISAASFYATYLQADAAEKQVKAMTFPLIHFEHGNVNDNDEEEIQLTLVNAGIGPAIIKSMTLSYKNQKHPHIFSVFNACCADSFAEYMTKIKSEEGKQLPQYLTSPVENSVLAGQSQLDFFRFKKHPANEALWQQINDVRFDIEFSACYCSLLGECFQTNEQHQLITTTACEQ